jgi:hypothetical protein
MHPVFFIFQNEMKQFTITSVVQVQSCTNSAALRLSANFFEHDDD